MVQSEIRIKFPKVKYQLADGLNTFVINEMKCRTVSVVYFILHLFNLDDEEILSDCEPLYIGERWVVDETWSSYKEEIYVQEEATEDVTKFIPKNITGRIKDVQIELVLINISDDNNLYFTECMLMNGAFAEYHEPEEVVAEAEIDFINNAYANVYPNGDDYLQVIRPGKDSFTTTKLTKSNCTVLAPHLAGETELDKPQNLFMEFMNQTEQTTNIKPI